MTLPHRFPFLLVARASDGKATVRLSIGDYWQRGSHRVALSMMIEATAQAAALAFPADKGADRLYLAAIQGCELVTPIFTGDSLEIDLVVDPTIGGAVRIGSTWRVDDVRVGGGSLLLVRRPN